MVQYTSGYKYLWLWDTCRYGLLVGTGTSGYWALQNMGYHEIQVLMRMGN